MNLYVDDVGGQPTHTADVSAGKQVVVQQNLQFAPGEHTITFELHAKEHPKVRGTDVEEYKMLMPMLRCRSRGYRFDLLKQIYTVQLSWNKQTRAELIAKADALLSENGIDPSTVVPGCPMACKQGRVSETHPRTEILTTWGRCYQNEYYRDHMAEDCNCAMKRRKVSAQPRLGPG